MSALAYLPQDATVFSVGPYSNREDRSYNKKMTYTRVYATFCTFFRFFSCIRLCMAIWLILYVYSPALYAVFFRLRLLARNFIPVLLSAVVSFVYCRRIVSGILLLFSRMPSEPLSHFHTSVWLHPLPISAYLCLFRHKTLPISAYLGIKWHIFVKSDFFSSIGLLVTYPILYLSSRFRKITKFIVLICQNDAIYRINLHNPDFFRTFAAGFFFVQGKRQLIKIALAVIGR